MREELSNIEIVLFALHKLGGISKKIHTEKIAWESYRLDKERFSWQLPEFIEKEFPDKTIVFYALGDAKKKKYGALVAGRGGRDAAGSEREGWRFTISGAQWIKQNEERIAKLLKEEKPGIQKRDAERFIKRIKNDFAFKQFKKDNGIENINRYNFTDLLSCPPDASIEVAIKLFENVRAEAEIVNNKEIIKFLELCQQKFLTQQPKRT
ncbi:hypothetical protein BH20BAC1_BH20BAC1_13540 [soil metagenome]